MKEFKGTPGPWFWENNALCNKDFIVGGSGHAFHNQANRSLLAAAPELLDTLRQLRDYVQDMYGDSYEDCLPDHPMMRAKSVIEKALGQ